MMSAMTGCWSSGRAPANSASSGFRERIANALDRDELDMVFQPAVRLDHPRIEFFEALARFPSPSGESPEVWFDAAADAGVGAEFEMLAVRSALGRMGALPAGSSVSINVSPATILSPIFAQQMRSSPLERIIVEITEREVVKCYESIGESLKPLRARGLRVAVDDAGAGHSSFRHILQIRPDLIKLDASLCRGVNKDPMRQALTRALISFCRQIGSDLVAEGIETANELGSLRSLGMSIIQGHIVCRPMSVERLRITNCLDSHCGVPDQPGLALGAA
jgi:EAL domain-containing protein (putative c-di-GMP-specific phosphodiesterase class I)